MRYILIITIALAGSMAYSQETIERPPIWGIAKMTFLVSDFAIARDYYGKFLGFDEAFSYDSEEGKIISFKVNDRQFLEFIEDARTRNKKRLVSVSLETENIDQMFQYLKSSGIELPDKVVTDGAGNKVIFVRDSSGNNIEFIEFTDNGLHSQSKGKFLSEQRISKRIHHAGLYAKTILDEDPFYTGIMKFSKILRYPDDRGSQPVMIYFGIPECTESIEHYLSDDVNISHPCFLVDDMQETVYTLKERNPEYMIGRPIIGKGKRWILNLANPDGTKVEFTEAFTVR